MLTDHGELDIKYMYPIRVDEGPGGLRERGRDMMASVLRTDAGET